MLEMQGQNQEDGDDGYEGEDYPQVWETWGKAGGNALGNFVEELLEQEGVTEADAQEWIDCIGYDMPEEVWRIIKETEQKEVLAAILLADDFVSRGTMAFMTRGREETSIPKAKLTILLSWFGLGERNRKTIPKRIARNRAYVMRLFLRGY
jgi:hypothetical protein